MSDVSGIESTWCLPLRFGISLLLAWGIALWLGLGAGVLFTFGEEGGKPGDSLLRIVCGELFLCLGVASMVIAFRLLWALRTPRALCAAALVIGLAQVAVLASALSLSHFVRSGLAWRTSTWRRLLDDFRLAELWAYYGWLGVTALAVGAVVVVVTLVRLFARQKALGMGA
jgi:hypothetical protein